jgi:hypothetical protein
MKKPIPPAAPKAQTPTKNGHYMGLHYGYEYEDGKYRIAPCVSDGLKEILRDENGLRQFLAIQQEYFGEQFKHIAERKAKWWKSTLTEYGLEGREMSYQDGWLIPVPPKSDQNVLDDARRAIRGKRRPANAVVTRERVSDAVSTSDGGQVTR